MISQVFVYKNNSTPLHVIITSEIKRKHFKRQLGMQEYNLDGYPMETEYDWK